MKYRVLIAALPSALMINACGSVAEREDTPQPGSDLGAKQSAVTAVPDEDLVLTPAGRVHRSCVYHVEDGAVLEPHKSREILPDGKVVTFPPCAHPRGKPSSILPDTNGWVERDSASATGRVVTDFVRMDGQWQVPSAPTNASSQTVFFFIDLLPTTQDAIIQPVLQWGPSSAGGSQSWAIASWFIDSSNNVFFSTLTSVSPNTTVSGSIVATSCSGDYNNCTWSVATSGFLNFSFFTIPVNTTLTVNATIPFTVTDMGVLEAYGIATCDQYPSTGAISFFNVHTYQPLGPLSGTDPQANITDSTAALFFSAGFFGVSPSCGFNVTQNGFNGVTLSY